MDIFAKQALKEYNDEAFAVRPGGVNGRAFWNINSSQFIYAPSFNFPKIPVTLQYEFFATDCTGKTYTFTADMPTASLAPIWKDLSVGIIELKVEALHRVNGNRYLAGARTFYKAPPFPGREALPPRACSYKECAIKAYRYAFNDSSNQYWLEHNKPDPNYYHNVYPSKMISGIVGVMLTYAKLEPDMADKALKIALNAADYLLSITYGNDTAVPGLPPTYSFEGLNKQVVDETAPMADKRKNELMLIYPANVGCMYLQLEQVTGDKKYFEAARKIAEYYKENVQDNGSWYLLVSKDTNKSDADNYCCTFDILGFLSAFYKRTKEEIWHTLEINYFNYIKGSRLETFNWEGQFEDIALTGNYMNLTHFMAGDYISYFCNNFNENSDKLETIKELMRFVEDQFVVWGEFAPWVNKSPETVWYSPAGLEQYNWYVPIDSSTAKVISDLLNVYSITKDELLLEKAYALGDSITRMQNKETGVIPTHWTKKDCSENIENFWINCHIYTASVMMRLAKINGEI